MDNFYPFFSFFFSHSLSPNCPHENLHYDVEYKWQKVDILVLFLISEGKLSDFYH